MKICFIRRRFSAVGGGELYLQRLMEALLNKGHTLHLLSEYWDASGPGVQFHAVAGARSRGRRALFFAEEVERILGTLRVDCVFSLERTFKQDIYRAGDGVHAVWVERQKEYAPFWRKPFCGLSAHHRNVLALEKATFDPDKTRFVIANSTMVREEIVQRFRFPAERIRVIPNGADLKRFAGVDRVAARRSFGFQAHEFVLLFVGSGWERKGLSFSLQLLRDLRERSAFFPEPFRSVRLLVAGKGKPPVFRDPDVVYTGPLKRVEDAYAAADLLAFLPIYEPAANVVTEALASRLPVLTTAFNGASEWIKPGLNGHVISAPTERHAALEAAIFWMQRAGVRPEAEAEVSMDRNVEATLELIYESCR